MLHCVSECVIRERSQGDPEEVRGRVEVISQRRGERTGKERERSVSQHCQARALRRTSSGRKTRVQTNRWENRVREGMDNNRGDSTEISADTVFCSCLPVCLSVHVFNWLPA